MTEAVPTIRVKLSCKDEAELSRQAPTLAARGVFVAANSLKPVGTRMRIKLELASGAVAVSGEAVVTRHADTGKKQGMHLHIVRLDPESYQFSLVPMGDNGHPHLPDPDPKTVPAAPSLPQPHGGQSLNADALFSDGPQDLLVGLGRSVAPHPATVTTPADVPLPKLTEPVAEEEVPLGRRPRWWLVAVGVALVAGVGIVTAMIWSSSTSETAFAAHIQAADERMASGRLAGPGGDEALDHLVEARKMKPEDPRVVQRLRALADKFEEFGDRALARGDSAEAGAHFQGAVLAEPTRASAVRKLHEVEEKARQHPQP